MASNDTKHHTAPEVKAACIILKDYMEREGEDELRLFLDTNNKKLMSVTISLQLKNSARKNL